MIMKMFTTLTTKMRLRHTEQFTTPSSAVYFDDGTLSVYHKLLEAEETELIRFGWTAPLTATSEVLVQRWANRPGSGGRTTMPHGKIMRFLMDRRLDDDVLSHDQVLLAVRKRIQASKLRPSIKTECLVTRFTQGALQVEVKTNLNILRELDSAELKRLQEWDTPNTLLQEHSVHQFPFAVMHITTSDPKGLPRWLQNMLNRDAFLRVDGFTEFLHGSAVLYPELARKAPTWVGGKFANLFTSQKRDESAPAPGKREKDDRYIQLPQHAREPSHHSISQLCDV
jgi:SPX domain protein involved in polyphosphate accumulation